MNQTNILHHALALDSIYSLLRWEDRLYLHELIRTKSQEPRAETLRQAQGDKLRAVLEWISDSGWQPPQMRYGHDRLLYYLEEYEYVKLVEAPAEWLPIEDYATEYPEITEQIQKLDI